MTMASRWARTGRLAVALLLVAGGALAAAPARADTQALLSPSALGWTDSAHPHAVAGTGDVPIGTRTDSHGVAHTTRAYATFDLSTLAGRSLSLAYFIVNGASTNACTSIKDLDLSRTATPAGPLTWADAPAELGLIGSVTSTSPACPGRYAEIDATPLVQAALAAGQGSFSVVARVPAAVETDPSYRALLDSDAIDLIVRSNGAPTVIASGSQTEGQACNTAGSVPWTWTLTPQLAAQYADPDTGDQLTSTWAIWPTDHPANRTTYPGTGYTSGNNYLTVPPGVLKENVSYSWSTQASDGQLTSAWSTPCRFRVDQTPPGVPLVTSPDLDTTGRAPAGKPIALRFAATSADVTLFQWSWDGVFPVILPGTHDPQSVYPNHRGGTATVSVNLPNTTFARLSVRSIDRAGNPSQPFSMFVSQGSAFPTVTWVSTPPVAGGTSLVRFTPDPLAGTVTAYEWTSDNGNSFHRVQARSDGTAQVRVTWPDQPEFVAVSARSISSNGYISTSGSWNADTYSPVWIHSDVYPEFAAGGGVGVPGTFVVYNRDASAHSVQYTFDSDPPVEVAFVHGRATIPYTPTVSGDHVLSVDPIEAGAPTGFPVYYGFGVTGP